MGDNPIWPGSSCRARACIAGGNPDLDPNGHGTAMAGIIAAVTNNHRGIAGIAYAGVKVMPVTVLDANGLGQDSDIIEGTIWAVDHGADVINMSFSNTGFSSSLQAAIDYAWDHDVVVVAATGNDGSSAATYPAGDRGVVGVSSTNESDRLDPSSNDGADTFLGAPGQGIRTLAAGGSTVTVSGTSAAAAEVAAAAGLLRAIDPGASNGVIVGRLGRSAADVGTRAETGNGRLDLARAVADDGTSAVRPAGVGASGGPFVGPYVAANKNLQITIVGGVGAGTIAFSNLVPSRVVASCGFSCTRELNDFQLGTLTVTPNPGFVFIGWTGTFVRGGTTTCSGTTNPCTFSMSNSAQQLTATFLETIPVATIDLQAASDSGTSNTDNITNAANLVFDITFDESVTGFTAEDLTNLGSATGCAIGAPVGSGAAYTVTLTGCSVGTVILRLRAGAVTNAAGGVNTQTNGPVVTIDRTGPTVTINQAPGQPDPTGSSPIRFAVVFSETVPNFDAADVVITGTAGGAKTATVTGSGALYTVSITGMTTSGTVIASITAGAATGLAGNPSSASTSTDNVVTWDTSPPSVTIDQAAGQPDPTNVSPIVFTVVFTEPVTGFATGDVTLTGSAGGTLVGVVTGGPTTYTVTVTGMTTTGTVVASIAPGVAVDGSSNPNLGSSSSDNIVLWDVTPPSVTIDQAAGQPDPTNTSPIAFTVVFSEPVVGFATGDVTIAGTAGGTKTATVSGGPVIWTVAVTGMTTSGTVIASIPASVATGLTGNPNAVSTSTDNTVTWSRATHLAFLQQPTDTVYGTSMNPAVTVQVLDANDALVTESSAPILLTVAPAGVGLRGIVPINAVNGIATFTDLSVDQVVGNFTLLAQSPGLTPAVSTPFKMLPAPLTITANDQTKPYGTTFIFTGAEFTTSGLVPGDTVDSLSIVSVGAAATAPVAGSPYPIVPFAADGIGLANYTITYVDGAMSVTIAALTITANDRTKPYGTTVTFTGTEFTTAGLLGTDTVTSVTLTSPGTPASASVAGSPYSIVPSAAVGTGLGNYAITYANGALTVTPATLTITADDRSKPYGTTVTFAGTEFTVSGLAPGDTVSSVTLASPGAAATATAAGSPYPINASAAVGTGLANYTITYVPGALTVTAATLTITATDRTKTYGTTVTFAGSEFTASGLQGSDTVTSVTLTSAGAAATAGVALSPYPITPSAALGTGLANYTISYLPGALTVTPASAVLSVTGYTVPYDGLPHTATGTATGVLGEDLSADLALSATTHSAAGSYPLDPWTFSDPSGDYVAASGTVVDEITPGSLTITATDRTKTYGTTVTFAGSEFTASGLQGSDSVTSVTLTSAGAAATAGVALSPYPITPSAALGTGLANYTISYLPGALTVTPATLTITADDQTKPSGVDFVFTGAEFSATGLLNADTVDSATLTSVGAPAAAAPGTYPIDISAAAGTGLANYTIAYIPGAMTVGNTAPTVGDATVTTAATTAVSGIVAVNDPDAGQVVTLTISSAPAHGTATVAQDGSFTYTPTGTYTGRDTFTIDGCDDATARACDSGTVSITIHPVAVDDAAVTSEGQTVEVDVQANDIGDAGTPRIVAGPANGTASVGSIIYTPDPGFSGTDRVVYRICSPNDATVCDDATLTVTVAPPGPTAQPGPTAPPTDANAGPTTPFDSEGGTAVLLLGLMTLVSVLTIAVLTLGRRRASSGQPPGAPR